MRGGSSSVLGVFVCLAVGCATEPPPVEPEVPEQCKKIHIDRLAGDWVLVKGKRADPKTRLRLESDGDGYRAYYVGGFFDHRAMKVDKRGKDLKLTEIASGEKKVRLYVQPSLKTCSLQVNNGFVIGDKEQVEPRTVEFLEMPDQGVTFSYLPPTETLFLGKAAKNKAAADREVASEAGPKVDHPRGAVVMGAWSDAKADGDPGCTYDMDLYFDDQLDAELSPMPAGPAKDGVRPWTYTWDLPYTGNHNLELYRYRTCGDGKRERIGVAGVSAILT